MSIPIHCYTARSVSQHKSPNDAWISIHGNVYDVSNFITVVSTIYSEYSNIFIILFFLTILLFL